MVTPTETDQELAADVVARWHEEQALMLAGRALLEAERSNQTKPAGTSGATTPFGRDLDVLRTIPSAEYVQALTGRPIGRGGFVQCPLHADGKERTPSLHVDFDEAHWHCFSCQHGGGIVEFYAAITGRTIPTGHEFVWFVGELADALGGTQ